MNEIESYFTNRPKVFENYVTDTKTKRAVERNLEIIGEAANRILKKDKDFNLNNIYGIIGTRNRIIHGYNTLSDQMIWSILINNLPKLRRKCLVYWTNKNNFSKVRNIGKVHINCNN